MINADFEIRRVLIKNTWALNATLNKCIEAVGVEYIKYMYSDPERSDLAKSIMESFERERKENQNDIRPKDDTTDKGISIEYP